MRQRTPVAITTAIVFALCWDAARAQDRRVTRAETTGRRLALIVGNNTYPVPLVNAANDARAVDAALRGIGFTTDVVTDATLEAMDRAVDAFVARIQPGDAALFYYSGHGVQVAGENYLIPIDFRGTDTTSLRRRTTSVSELQERLQERGARIRILILDACRDNPYRGTRSGAQGLAAYQAEGAIIAYATAAGRTASDNAGGTNGLFTTYFLRALNARGVGVSELFRNVREAVSTASNGQQVPWVADGLIGHFAFVPGDGAPVIGPPPPAPVLSASEVARREELAYWESIKDSTAIQPFTAYLQRYGDKGVFSAPVRLKLAEVTRVQCEAGNPADCVDAGLIFEHGKGVAVDVTRAFGLYKRACDGADMRGCSNLASMYAQGKGVATDFALAESFFQRACENGFAAGCSGMAFLFEMGKGFPVDLPRAARFYQEGCDGGDASGCVSLGMLYDAGKGVAADPARAASLYQRACDASYGAGCSFLASMHEAGRGGLTRNPTRSRELFQKACQLGFEPACRRLN